MTPADPWYAEPLGFLLMLGLPLLVTWAWVRSEGWRDRRREARRPVAVAAWPYRVALRPDDSDALDDVVVCDVSMFRAELMSDRDMWLCCYLPGTGTEHDRVAFAVRAVGKHARLEFSVTEHPFGDVSYEPQAGGEAA